MPGQLAKTATALVGVLFVGASVAVGWSYLEPLEEPHPEVNVSQYPGVRVFYERLETRMVTEEHGLPNDGVIHFEPMRVPLANVTRVTVTLHTDVDGIALNDEYEVTVRSPDGGQEQGVWSGPLINPSGYRSSVVIIPEWQRASMPQERTYETSDIQEALEMNAHNHTHVGSRGDWEAQVVMSLPGLSRSGSVGLSFTFVHYEALAALEHEARDDRRECPQEDRDPVEDSEGDCPRPEGEPAGTQGERGRSQVMDAPRTFITGAGVARSVDRDPGPHSPL